MRWIPERTTLALAGLALVLGAAPAGADWIVTADGVEIETRGAWRVDGQQVVFTAPSGRLASLRLSECDLEASRALTAERSRPARPSAAPRVPPAKPSGPVLVLTDADVGHVRPAPPAARPGRDPRADRSDPGTAATDEPRSADDDETARRPDGDVVVAGWSPRDEDDGIEIRGQVRNDSPNVAGRVKVMAIFRDADGEEIEKRPAALSTSTLKPGQKADFLIRPFGLFSYGSIDFEVRHFTLLTGSPEAPAAGGSR